MGIDVDPCLFFTKQQVEDLTARNFNPGDCLALFFSCDKGYTLLACMGMTMTQEEKYRVREEAEDKSKTNRSLSEALQLKSTDHPTPPDHFQTFKLLLGTFAGMLCVMFGGGCDYYNDVYGAQCVLKEKGVAMLADQFTPHKIRQYCWTIID